MTNNPAIFVAADTPDPEFVAKIARITQESHQGLKLGLEYFNALGPQGVAKIRQNYPDLPVFLDLKYHDIPNTVRSAVREVSKLGIDYINVHVAGGVAMMQHAVEGSLSGAVKAGVTAPKVLGVTLLTSLDKKDLTEVGYERDPASQVLRMANLAKKAGLNGVVCSAAEIVPIRENLGGDFVLMVPGIRPEGSASDDQKRIMAPAQAIAAGATHLVIGRPITQARDPEQTLAAILETLT